MDRNDNAQMMVIESILFSIMVILSLMFVSNISPPSRVSSSLPVDQLKILGDDALRTIDKTTPTPADSYLGSSLVKYILEKDVFSLTNLLNSLLPDISYNLYLSNGIETIKWYDGEVLTGGKHGAVSKSHMIIILPLDWIDPDIYPDGIITDYDGVVYDFILEMWYI